MYGNCTFTLWKSEQAMQRFAYGQPPGDHRKTIRQNQDRSVLIEQLSARLTPLRIEGSWDPASTPNGAALQRLARTLDNARLASVWRGSPRGDTDDGSRRSEHTHTWDSVDEG